MKKKEESKIVGQNELIDSISRIFDIFVLSKTEIRPHFILTGPSGSGKSFTIHNLADAKGLSYIEINAAQLTKEGTSGNSLSKVLSPLRNMQNKPVVCFVDEFDKLFISGNSNNTLANEVTTGVQNEFLKVLESDTTETFGDYGKYIPTKVSNVLFVFAGAFNGEENITVDRLRELGVKTEFIGRVGLVYNTKPLTLEDLYLILERSELLDKYIRLFDGVEKEQVIEDIKEYLKQNFKFNDLGARLINTIINQYFINDGNLTKNDIDEISFTKKISFQ